MRKFILTIFLFISSFFFFALKEVYAESYTRTITEADISLINDDFLDFRNQVIEFCGDTKSYIIYYQSNTYMAVIYDKESEDAYTSLVYSAPKSPWLRVRNVDIYEYKDNELTFNSTPTSNKTITIYNVDSISGYQYLDANVSFKVGGTTYTTIYNEKSYSFPYIESSLYYIYLDNLEPEDPYIEDKGLLSSFYTVVIEKISYLATTFAINYVFLTILGVFLLIYVIELVRRLLR